MDSSDLDTDDESPMGHGDDEDTAVVAGDEDKDGEEAVVEVDVIADEAAECSIEASNDAGLDVVRLKDLVVLEELLEPVVLSSVVLLLHLILL